MASDGSGGQGIGPARPEWPTRGCLRLGAGWNDAETTLVSALEAYRLTTAGTHRPLLPMEAQWLFRRIVGHEMFSVRRFYQEIQLLQYGFDRVSDAELQARIAGEIERGGLVGIQKAQAFEPATAGGMLLRELASGIEGLLRGPIILRGERYRLVAAFNLGRFAEHKSSEVVRRADAEKVLGDLIKASGTSRRLGELLTQARDRLTQDWRPPMQPDGLVLLRQRSIQGGAKVSEAPTISPSELRRQLESAAKEKTWVEIQLLAVSGAPYSGDVEVQLPDGRAVRSKTGADGVLRVDEVLVAGDCKVRFPGLRPTTCSARL